MTSGTDTRPGVPSLLRVLNDRRALDLMLTNGATTRADLSRSTGLSRVTASQSLARLQARGLVEVVGSRSAGRGPNADVYAVRADVGSVVGIDLRPSSVGVRLACATGEVLAQHTARVERVPPIDVVEQVTAALLAETSAQPSSILSAVVGLPGLVDPDDGGTVFSTDFADASAGLRDTLQRRLGVPVTLENDVNLAAVAERGVGAAVGHASFVLVWIGTGVGLAVMVDGRLHRGSTGAAGEIGYLPVATMASHDGIDETTEGDLQRLVGTAGIAALARAHGLARGAGDDAANVAAAFGADDDAAHPAFVDEVARRIALGVASVCAVLDPGLVVLTGHTALAGGDALAAAVAQQVRRIAPVRPTVALSAVGDAAVLHGATQRALRLARNGLLDTVDGPADE